jgi:UDP-N-acetylglucosamine--N-acetylmuramyl-(pentapeptide) pyrophosphoryl-undecaprenol N-acetylglucosamine transferase
MTKNVIFAVGGSGGHLIPAQVAAKEWLENDSNVRIQFLGDNLKQSQFFDSSAFDFIDISSATLSWNRPLKSLKVLGRLLKGIWASYNFFKQRRPHLVVGFGSYHSFPVILVAVLRKVPVILIESNIYPGQVNRFFAKFAKAVVVPYSECRKYLKDPVVQTKFPLQKVKTDEETSKQEAADYFGLDPNKLTFLICGGSQGAHIINLLTKEALETLSERGYSFQVIHLCGRNSDVHMLEDSYKRGKVTAVVKTFENSMHHAYNLSDLAICRGGAMTMADLIEFELPAIMIPFARAKENHQDKNADYFVEHIAGGIKLREELATSEKLLSVLFELLSNKRSMLQEYRAHLKEFKATLPSKSLVSYLQAAL